MTHPEHLAARLADRPGFVWLDGGRDSWHVLAWDPVDVVTDAARWPDAARSLLRAPAESGDAPFRSGVLGYVGYGAGWAVEAVPAQAPTPEPPVWLARFEHALCWRRGRWLISGSEGFRRDAEALLATGPLPDPVPAEARRASTCARSTYEARVRQIQAWIRDGDCYQVNLSRAVFVDVPAADVFATYRRLRRHSDARFGAWLCPDPDNRVLSNSPELLLGLDGDRVWSIPIKGTRPRGVDPAADRALRDALERSPKDRAELAMIVDLVRNDLAHVAARGSVVAAARRLDAHATVHHASWQVDARLRDDRDGVDALAALFPPGSVTGAPKVRATERIQQLEDDPRGVYCGSIGWLDDRGSGRWSVAIRTGVWSAGQLRYHVGGGIVVGSDPADEWRETEHKGRALAAAAGVTDAR